MARSGDLAQFTFKGLDGTMTDGGVGGQAACRPDALEAVERISAANVMGWETFREFHDCYLHTDVLALADVSGRSRGSTPSTTSRCPGPPGTPCCGTWPARLPFTSSPTSRPRLWPVDNRRKRTGIKA